MKKILENYAKQRHTYSMNSGEEGNTWPKKESWKMLFLILNLTICFKMKKIHYKTLRVIYQSDESFENLLIFDNSVSLHKGNLSFLVTEIFKSVSKVNSQFRWFYCSYKNLNILRRGYLQRLQGMERILSILKVHLIWVTLFFQIQYLSSWI